VCSPPVPRRDLALCTELFAEVRQPVAATAEQVLNVSRRVCHVDDLTPDLVKACNVSGVVRDPGSQEREKREHK
jgi:hypothetical protein